MARRVIILCAERIKHRAIAELCQEYLHRLRHYNVLASLEECPSPRRRDPEGMVAEQSACLLRRITPDDRVIVLDERGTQYTSERFAELVARSVTNARNRTIFVIGGAYGLDDALRHRADTMLSLGAMTFPHELARLVLCEQLYRAMTILHRQPYHHGSTDE